MEQMLKVRNGYTFVVKGKAQPEIREVPASHPAVRGQEYKLEPVAATPPLSLVRDESSPEDRMVQPSGRRKAKKTE